MKKICVIGSLNIDLTVSIPRFHLPGETILGTDFKSYTGGKGGNQAVAAAKLGVETCMLGKLGSDSNAEIYRRTLRGLGIHDESVLTSEDCPSGTAIIEVDAKGENRIIVVSGANMRVDEAQIDQFWPQLCGYDLFLLQLEIPLTTVSYAVQKLRAAGKTVILDPAPAVAALPTALLQRVDYLTPNETELSILSGLPTDTDENVKTAARSLIDKGVSAVIAKLGARGAMLVTKDAAEMVKGFKVKAVDTTAAGDSFNAGLAAALSKGLEPAAAVRFANAVGAISTTAVGAQGAMPSFDQAMRLYQSERA